jgi:hypothetical protein
MLNGACCVLLQQLIRKRVSQTTVQHGQNITGNRACINTQQLFCRRPSNLRAVILYNSKLMQGK